MLLNNIIFHLFSFINLIEIYREFNFKLVYYIEIYKEMSTVYINHLYNK